jgi:hypothetical protein
MARAQGIAPFRVIADRTYWGKIVRHAVAKVTTSQADEPQEELHSA